VNVRSEPPEQSFSLAQESYLCANILVSKRISAQMVCENGEPTCDLRPHRDCARILRCIPSFVLSWWTKTCCGARGR
jgi:hypothetical protein